MEAFVTLNVGGSLFTTTRATLTRFPSSMLGAIFKYVGPVAISKDEHGRVFIDRDGDLFRHVLNYLRRGYLVLPEDFSKLDMLADEAMFYELPKLVDLIHEHKIRQSQKGKSASEIAGPTIKPNQPLKNAKDEKATERELLIVKLLYENYADMTTYDKFLVLKRSKTIHATSGHLTGRVDTFREIPNPKFNQRVRDQFSDASSAFIVSLPLAPAYATEHQLFQDLTKIGFQVDGFSSELRCDKREGEQTFFSYKTLLFTRQRSTGIQP
ncbi:BTB/POZ domain-containing protein KCTD21 [Holothuria leucospilota]|uniref:BTB/POZ domain-containing protein KCTD21 n=1 Tax=Holothuria leucospilota TaxID=206669 RepID=A0A9Q1BJK7_HOLLE|nr:BTB/POZ domain-containing protein KCTD21 [Holothuria leucospilota]